MLESSNERFEEMLAELARELERAQEETRRSRQLAAIGATIDLDAVLAPDARGRGVAAARRRRDGRTPQTTSRARRRHPRDDRGGGGIAPRRGAAGPGPRRARGRPSPTATRRAAEADGEPDPRRSRPAARARTAATRSGRWPSSGARTAASRPTTRSARLEELVRNAGPAIENARRFREARKLADLDALTSLHNRRYFHDTLAREVARAHRYDRRLALVLFDIDDFKAINDARRPSRRRRACSHSSPSASDRSSGAPTSPCRVGGDEFAVILPESTLADAEQLYRRAPVRRLDHARPAQPSACTSRPASPSSRPRTIPSRSSSEPTRRCSGPRRPARARPWRPEAS